MTKVRNGPDRNRPILKHGTPKTRTKNALTKHRNGSTRTQKMTKTRNGLVKKKGKKKKN